MRVQDLATKASSLSSCTEVNTSTFGTTTIEHAYELQRTISNFGTIKADEIFKPTTKTTPRRRSKDLRSIQEWKRDINYIASGLAQVDHQSHDQQMISYSRKTAGKLSSCLNHTWFDVSTKKARGHLRCKSHACPFCVYKKQQQRIKDFSVGVGCSSIKSYEYDYLSLVTIVFTNKTRHYLDMRSQLQRLNKAVSQLLRYRKYRDSVVGTVRSIEPIESNLIPGDAHLHLHMLGLVKRQFTFFSTEFEEKLSKLVGEEVRVFVKTEVRDPDPIQAIEQIKKGFIYLHKAFGLPFKDKRINHATYGSITTSAIREQSIDFYLHMTRAIKGLRLYNSTGFFRDMLRAGKDKRESSQDVRYLPHDECDEYPRKNEILLYWKRREIIDRNRRVDIGSYFVSKADLDIFLHEMSLLLPPQAKTFTWLPKPKEVRAAPAPDHQSKSSKVFPSKKPKWMMEDSQLNFGFNNALGSVDDSKESEQ